MLPHAYRVLLAEIEANTATQERGRRDIPAGIPFRPIATKNLVVAVARFVSQLDPMRRAELNRRADAIRHRCEPGTTFSQLRTKAISSCAEPGNIISAVFVTFVVDELIRNAQGVLEPRGHRTAKRKRVKLARVFDIKDGLLQPPPKPTQVGECVRGADWPVLTYRQLVTIEPSLPYHLSEIASLSNRLLDGTAALTDEARANLDRLKAKAEEIQQETRQLEVEDFVLLREIHDHVVSGGSEDQPWGIGATWVLELDRLKFAADALMSMEVDVEQTAIDDTVDDSGWEERAAMLVAAITERESLPPIELPDFQPTSESGCARDDTTVEVDGEATPPSQFPVSDVDTAKRDAYYRDHYLLSLRLPPKALEPRWTDLSRDDRRKAIFTDECWDGIPKTHRDKIWACLGTLRIVGIRSALRRAKKGASWHELALLSTT